jgi:hypothetical protein
MTYEEIEPGMGVRIAVSNPKHRETGVVKDKAIERIAGKDRERIYVDTKHGGRRVCVPSVLERTN